MYRMGGLINVIEMCVPSTKEPLVPLYSTVAGVSLISRLHSPALIHCAIKAGEWSLGSGAWEGG